MNNKRIIRKLLTACFWLIAGAGLVTLLVAANRRDMGHAIREVRITIKGDGEQFFIDKSDILLQLTVAAKAKLVGKPLDGLDLARLEQNLEKGVWIRDAELWIDSKDVLHVQVTEREPAARVFNTAGASFYIDSSGQAMPLLEKESARVLVVTNYPGAVKFNHQDSLRAAGVKAIVNRINTDPFWKEQIAQVDITPAGVYEAIPVVGNHVIRLGDASQLDVKLSRLMTFYKKVLSRAGFDRYAVVDVQFDGQVVGVRRGATSVVDSLQLQKNIVDLLARAQQQLLHDSLMAVEQLSPAAETQREHRTMPLDSIGEAPVEAATTVVTTTAADTARQRPATVAPKPAATQPAPKPVTPKPATPKPVTPKPSPVRTATPKPATRRPTAVMPKPAQRARTVKPTDHAPPKPKPKRTTNEY